MYYCTYYTNLASQGAARAIYWMCVLSNDTYLSVLFLHGVVCVPTVLMPSPAHAHALDVVPRMYDGSSTPKNGEMTIPSTVPKN